MSELLTKYKRQFGLKFSNFGSDKAGHDIKVYGDTPGKYIMWDASANTFTVSGTFAHTGGQDFSGPVNVGVNGTGYDVKFYGDTAGKYMMWDESADLFTVVGGSAFVGQLTVGIDDTGHDVIFYGATTGKYMMWDESADRLLISGSADLGDSCEANAYTVGGVPGVDYGPAAVASITVVKGIVTAIS